MTVSRVASDTLFDPSCCREQKYISSRSGSSLSERLQNAPNLSFCAELLQPHRAVALLTDQIICRWLLTLLGLILLHKQIPP